VNKGPPLETQATVLVVDDEPLVRILSVQVLEQVGFRVEEAGNSEEALSRLDGHQIAALVTDVDMPGPLDGLGLAWRVHELFPAAAIFVISGVTTPDSGDLPPNARFLTKPFDPKRLVRELDKTLRKA
jgi:CheY-like chemotaxis protein